MDIRKITKEELAIVMECASGMTSNVLLPAIPNPSMREALTTYVSEANLSRLMEAERLHIWAAFENGLVAGICGMESNGHLTMLYVYPMFQHKGIGKSLLNEAVIYAMENLGAEAVTVNVMPVYPEGFFKHHDFKRIEHQPCPQDFISMYREKVKGIVYKKKPVPFWVWIFAAVVFLISCVVLEAVFFLLL